MHRHELTDEQWEIIKGKMPLSGGRGRPWQDHRRMINGMMWILRTGAPWRDLPERYGPWQTVYDRFNRWRKEERWDRILERLQIRLDQEGKIDWDLWCVDGSVIRAHRSAAGAREKGGLPTNPRTTRWVAHRADGGQKSIWSLTARALR